MPAPMMMASIVRNVIRGRHLPMLLKSYPTVACAISTVSLRCFATQIALSVNSARNDRPVSVPDSTNAAERAAAVEHDAEQHRCAALQDARRGGQDAGAQSVTGSARTAPVAACRVQSSAFRCRRHAAARRGSPSIGPKIASSAAPIGCRPVARRAEIIGDMPSQQAELDQPGGDLRWTDQRGGGDGDRLGRSHRLQQPRQVRRHGGRDEPGGAEYAGQHDHRPRHAGRRLTGHAPVPAAVAAIFGTSSRFIGSPISRCSAAHARQAPRQPNASMKISAGRPADRAGESGEQRDAGDRIARIAAVEAGDGGERRLVQAEAHADAEDGPGHREADRAGRRTPAPPGRPRTPDLSQSAHRARRIGRSCGRPAVPAGRTAAGPPRRCRRTTRAAGQAGRDRIGEHGREIVGRTPGQSLRDAECGDDDAAAVSQCLCHGCS